ncbi:hypothetical protein HNQ59_000774 [Chitinivorax tropicus]|uniref:Oxidoreductase molybdopterin-binding domain-containing protein n=1 Tax=Chitinivorax tropicus TaxID=714531 RepID=A0A840MJ17_9PROT|nr:hypothetical protein [Chitinivorax tropicus]MBB5017505.1 hypothetical protein [Chitinivorax tropicus]
MKWLCLFSILCCASITSIHAGELTIAYRDHKEIYDDRQLESMPQTGIQTYTQWNPDDVHYEGPKLSHFLKLRHANSVTVIAANGYVSSLPLADIERYQPILALSGNGRKLTIKEKGPYLIMFPYRQHSELRRVSRENLFVWYVKKIIVH